MYQFGIGTLIFKPTTALQKQALIGTIQDVEVDFDQALVELIGQKKVADAIAGGQLKITWKAKAARISAALLATTALNATPQTGQTIMAQNENHTIASHAVTVTNSATFVEDLGVFDALTGDQMQPVASSPAIGQYSVSAGVYTFNASETVLAVNIYYTYTASGGFSLPLANSYMGSIPTFSLYLQESFTELGVTKIMFLKLNACVSGKLAMPMKNKDFLVYDLDGQAFADASGNIGTLSTSD